MNCSKTIQEYQYWRKKIPHYEGKMKIFLMQLKYNRLPIDSIKGLTREFRAYFWLVKKYPNDQVAISTAVEDSKGIDLVIERSLETRNIFIKFAVSGPGDKEPHNNCNYKITVTNGGIYMNKVETPEKTRSS